MRNLEKFWCNDHLEEVAGDCGRYFPGGKEACLEQAERILKNSFVFRSIGRWSGRMRLWFWG